MNDSHTPALEPLDRRMLRGLLRLLVKPVFGAAAPLALQRSAMVLGRPLGRIPAGMRFEPVPLGGVQSERVSSTDARGDTAILYLHGGGYCIGSPRSHRALTAGLATRSGLPVHVPDYRLAPEHPFPAAADDALAAYRGLLAQGCTRVVLAGDSAGGGLALATAVAAAGQGLAAPAALLLISPWVDLRCSFPSFRTHARRDPMLGGDGLRRWAAAYCGGAPAEPRCSPLLADLRGLPPVLIQAGSEEVLLDEQHHLERALAAAGVPVRLQVAAGLWHVYPIHAGLLADADAALERMARFLREQGL